MLTHADIWRGIDKLAELHGLSPSGLAKRAGLDPTTFNKSKRATREGKQRWPSTESLAKVLEATGTSMAEFVALIDEGAPRGTVRSMGRLKAIRFSELATGGHLDAAGFPVGTAWDEIDFPQIDDAHAYIVELDRDLAPPFYREGDLVVVSPESSVRRGDRVLYAAGRGKLAVGLLERRTANRTVFRDMMREDAEHALDNRELSWLARIIWVSQ